MYVLIDSGYLDICICFINDHFLDVEKLAAKEIEKFKHGGRLFAVIYLGGHQWKITTEDILVVQGHMHFDVGDRIRLEKVLLVGGENFTLVGRPLLPYDKNLKILKVLISVLIFYCAGRT